MWPAPGLVFHHPILTVPPDLGRPSVFIVAGHGAPGNRGNVGWRCQAEEAFTLDAASDLADRLAMLGIFDVTEARTGTTRPSYTARLRHLARSGADVAVELHSDARGSGQEVAGLTLDHRPCWRNDDAPGVSVLVSDQGPAALNADRLALARHVADALGEVGFGLYDQGYGDQYDADSTPGVFLDRRGLRMLRRPGVPSILIETHNALDGRETQRWNEAATRDAFARAMTEALLRYFTDHPPG